MYQSFGFRVKGTYNKRCSRGSYVPFEIVFRHAPCHDLLRIMDDLVWNRKPLAVARHIPTWSIAIILNRTLPNKG